jgi:23S rRNA pseudouridine2605 synthase
MNKTQKPSIKKTELQRLLSKLGIASRSKAAELIKSGKVSVNGKIEKDPLSYISLNSKIKIIGNDTEDLIKKSKEKILIAFNKPKGVVTTKSDEKGRKTVYDVLPKEFHHLNPIGRLDMATTGLLLFTNDNYLADKLLDPKNKISRTYVAVVKGEISNIEINKLTDGIIEDKELLKAKSIEIKKVSKKESTIIITLEQGKNREIRRLLSAINHEVIKLKRISFGEIHLGELEIGKIKILEIPKIKQ